MKTGFARKIVRNQDGRRSTYMEYARESAHLVNLSRIIMTKTTVVWAAPAAIELIGMVTAWRAALRATLLTKKKARIKVNVNMKTTLSK